MAVRNFQPEANLQTTENKFGRFELVTLKKRSQFLAMKSGKSGNSGAHSHARSFVLQARRRKTDETRENVARFGFTVTKRVGNSVVRSRIKRRLRAAVQQCGEANLVNPGFDYVLIGKRAALSEDFTIIVKDLCKGLDRDRAVGANPLDEKTPPKLELGK